jgi:tryptophanase
MNLEPYRIKVVERIKPTTIEERKTILQAAGYNPFLIPAKKVFIDLISDSGTSALSSEQWAVMVAADEAFAVQDSYDVFIKKVKDLTGFKYIFPIHQARAGEHIIFLNLMKPGLKAIANTFFETTRENIHLLGGGTVDLPDQDRLFPGNLNAERLKTILKTDKVGFVLLTVTSNRNGGQPVSLENVRAVQSLARRYKIPLVIDGCRFAENAYFIKEREAGYKNKPLTAIAKELFSCADIAYFSAKKDGLSNAGGFIGTNNKTLAGKIRDLIMLFEGFFTHGGLAGRDLAAVAQGLDEVMDESYLKFRIEQVRFLGNALAQAGVPVKKPFGGHAVCVRAEAFASAVKEFAGFSLANAVYLEGGVRGGVFGGTLGLGPETFRLAIPRRVYTNSQLEYTAGVVRACTTRKLKPLKLVSAPEHLKTFTAQFTPLENTIRKHYLKGR